MTFQVSDNFSIIGGFGYVNARLLNEGTDTAADGRRPPKLPIDNGGLALKYDFKSLGLPGLSLHAGVRYVGVSYPETTASTAGEDTLRLPAYYVVDTGIDYSWTQEIAGFKIGQTVGLSVDNALNADYVNVNLEPEAPRGYFIRYTISH